MVALLLSYSNKNETVMICQRAAKLFEMLPPAPQVIPPTSSLTFHKRLWKSEEDAFIRQQYEAGITITEIARQLASNYWAIKKRAEQLGLMST